MEVISYIWPLFFSSELYVMHVEEPTRGGFVEEVKLTLALWGDVAASESGISWKAYKPPPQRGYV